ncbi:hypothetical protein NW754_016645 [Fusarium falciforme]|nr:hypothetical protein NW754_016645 [Fusarium falciforme]
MKHIDRGDLYTNLKARVQYLHSFLDFSSRDIEALITGAKYVKALIPAVVNIVYKKLLQYDITARAFTTEIQQDGVWEYLDKVGMMHVGLGRKHPLHIKASTLVKWHVKDGAEFETGDSDIEIEREGYLHGKRIIGEGSGFGY